MRQKITKSAFFTALIVLVISLSIVCGAMYRYYTEELLEELRSEADLIFSGYAAAKDDYIAMLDERYSGDDSGDTRITLVDSDGTVLYDSAASAEEMGDVPQFEEISEDVTDNTGEAVRISETLTEKYAYIERAFSEGIVLRVSVVLPRAPSLIFSMRWYILAAVTLSVAVAYITARYTSKRIVSPINAINPEVPEIEGEYEELSPLIKELNRQKWDIADQSSELRRKQRELNVIMENMHEGLLMIDNKCRILTCNESALQLLGAQNADISGSVYALNRSDTFRRTIEKALSGTNAEGMMSYGGTFCHIIASPVQRYGEVTGAVILILDETEKQEREALRREFTSNVSHELKTPLTSVYGVSELLLSGMVKPEDVDGFVRTIHDETGRLITLVEDIIRLSRLDEGSAGEKRETVELLALARLVAQRLQHNSAGVALEVSGYPTEVVGIYTVLDEILYNLCENAVKYNVTGGKVSVNVFTESADAVITVDDSGIGIPESERSRIFERFYRVDKSHSKKIGGTGLGLSIVKHAVLYHGGTVTVSDSPLGGTRMTVRLPKDVGIASVDE